jgi:5-methylcytosine-specific restriction endonuclease McrA
MLSWDLARMATAKRDDYKCQICGTPVYLFKPFNIEGYTTEDKIKYADYFRCCQGEKQAEIHHIIPVGELLKTAYDATVEIVDPVKREYWFWKLGVMLQLDINNLTTLCEKPCHDEAHNHAANIAKKLSNIPKLESYGGKQVG